MTGPGSLRVAVLSSIAHRTPPRAYGPWELVASTIAEGLVARGHAVTLFATADSLTKATLSAIAPTGYEEDPVMDAKAYECLHIASLFERAADFDVISNQFDFLPLSYSRLVKTPVVTTIHGFSSSRILPVFRRYQDVAHYVSISDADRHPSLEYATTIHHGLDPDAFTFVAEPGGFLLFLGRIHPDKGVHHAIALARRVGLPLVIAGIIQDQAYFEARVRPSLGHDGIEYVGVVEPRVRDSLLGGALALVHLIDFDEPFGLSVIEALATGTPVIANRRGSMPELVRHEETGFLVQSMDQAADAVGAVGGLRREDCRRDVVARFTSAVMVDRYERLFADITEVA